MADESMIRSFLALDPPEAIRREIGKVQERLRKMIRGDLRWVRTESIHLTLKFFGDIPRNAVPGISAAAGGVAAGFAPFDLSIGGVGVFPDIDRPRVVWLGMNGEVERLAAFQQELERAIQAIGFPREERPFRPHLTLARIKSPKGVMGLAQVLERGGDYAAGRFTAAGLVLFKSDLTPGGAIYSRIAEYPFAGENRG